MGRHSGSGGLPASACRPAIDIRIAPSGTLAGMQKDGERRRRDWEGGRRTGGSRCGCCGPARRCCGLARHNSCGPARNGRKGPDDPQPLERGQGAFLYAPERQMAGDRKTAGTGLLILRSKRRTGSACPKSGEGWKPKSASWRRRRTEEETGKGGFW